MKNKIFNMFIICIICIVPLIITPWRTEYYYQAKALVLYMSCLFIFVFFIMTEKNFNTKFHIEDKILFIYCYILGISTLFSVNFFQSLLGKPYRYEGFFTMLCYCFIFFIASKKYCFSRKHLYFLFTSAALISFYAILQYLGYNIIKVDPIRSKWIKYAYSTIGNPNFLASYLTLILPLSLFCYLYLKKVIYLIFSCVFYFTLLLTKTRSAWLGTILSVICLACFVIKSKTGVKNLILAIIFMTAITFSLNFYSNKEVEKRFVSIFKDAKKVVSSPSGSEYPGSTRMLIWKRAVRLIPERPFLGYGPDTFDIAFMGRFRVDVNKYIGKIIIDKAHNEYLQIAVATGIPSLIAYLSFLYFVLSKSFKNANKNILIVPLFCSITGYLSQAFFNISVVSVAPVFWALLGVLDSFANSTESP